MVRLSLLVGVLGVVTSSFVAATCYYPDGTESGSSYIPCVNSDSGASTCCDASWGDKCLSNGLCWYPGHYIARGSCTDKTWQSGNCTSFCKTSNSDTYQYLASCGGTMYCCGSTNNCCSNSALVFDIGTPYMINDFGTPVTEILTGTALVLTTASPTSTTLPTMTSSVPSPQSASNAGKIGVIIASVGGIILLVVALGSGIGVLCCLMRKKKAAAATQPVNLDNLSSTPGYGYDRPVPSKAESYYTSSPVPSTAVPWNSSAHEYYAPYQERPKTADGRYIAEVDSTPALPSKHHGAHELA